jgi:hypothetical protein
MQIKDRLKAFFYDRSPNPLLEDYVLLEFSGDKPADVLAALSALESEGFLTSSSRANQFLPHLIRKRYSIAPTMLNAYPIRDVLEIAGIRVPRMIQGDTASAEDVSNRCESAGVGTSLSKRS